MWQLKAAFTGESQGNRRYLFFAKKAEIEGYPKVAGLFCDTAEGEIGHAHGHLDYLRKVAGPATDMPFGEVDQMLASAVAGTTHEYTDMYPAMGRTARLQELVGLDSRLWLHVGDSARVATVFAPARISQTRVSSVQYLKFPLTVEQARLVKTAGTGLRVVADPRRTRRRRCSARRPATSWSATSKRSPSGRCSDREGRRAAHTMSDALTCRRHCPRRHAREIDPLAR